MSPMPDNGHYVDQPWRVGRKVGRTIYACRYEPGELIGGAKARWIVAADDDPLIGVMDTSDLARAAVEAHNAALPNA